VPNVGIAGQGKRLRAGMTIAIEPMLTRGEHDVHVLGDRWTVVTADGSLAAHVEHTVAITDAGCDVLAA
jgi:methionyl aminopeptidase